MMVKDIDLSFGLQEAKNCPPMPEVKPAKLAINEDLIGEIISYLETFKVVQQYRGPQFYTSMKEIDDLITRIKEQDEEQGEEQGEPYPPPSRLIKENCAYEIKQCIHCEHSFKNPMDMWRCKQKEMVKSHVSLVAGDSYSYMDCDNARAGGLLGLFKGKCGPEAKYYEVRKFKENPILPKEKQL